MARYSEPFARFVQLALERQALTPRTAARKTEGLVSHQTVNQMRLGEVPSPRIIVLVALALGEEPDLYLEAAGEPFRYTGPRSLAEAVDLF